MEGGRREQGLSNPGLDKADVDYPIGRDLNCKKMSNLQVLREEEGAPQIRKAKIKIST